MAAELTFKERERRMLRLSLLLDEEVREAVRKEGCELDHRTTAQKQGQVVLWYACHRDGSPPSSVEFAKVSVPFAEYGELSNATRQDIVAQVREQLRQASDA